MKLSRFLIMISALTFFSLLYVYQQTEIMRLAYRGQENLVNFEDLLDKNTILRYNIKKDSSLVELGNKITKDADFQMPNTYRLVKLIYPPQGPINSNRGQNKQSILARIFGIKREAQAETINP